jgi:hypothetical protein
MATIILRPFGRKSNPELHFRGSTKKGAISAAKSYMRSHNIAGFKDESGVFHPIHSGEGYSRSAAGEGKKRRKKAKGKGKKKSKK